MYKTTLFASFKSAPSRRIRGSDDKRIMLDVDTRFLIFINISDMILVVCKLWFNLHFLNTSIVAFENELIQKMHHIFDIIYQERKGGVIFRVKGGDGH